MGIGLRSARFQEIEPQASKGVGGPTNSSKTIATRSATHVEVWANVIDIGVAGVLDVFYDISPDGTNFIEELSATGIVANGLVKVGVLTRNDKDSVGLAGRARFTVTTNAVEFEIFALVRE